MRTEPLYVANPLLPEFDDFVSSVKEIWDSRVVTNHGPYHNQLERQLEDVFLVDTVKLYNNGTNGLLAALKIFDFPIGSEVITTPFTFAATTHSITWNGLVPVFADIEGDRFTIDPECVEAAITDKTVAILAVHVYGNPCKIEQLEIIAKKHNLKLIFDGAHSFDTKYNGRGIASYGDLTVFSFHATKLFNTIEGGAIATSDTSLSNRLYIQRNFGIKNENEVIDIGINGKMNEIQALVGCLNLKKFQDEKRKRQILREIYNDIFTVAGVSFQSPEDNWTLSEQYYPLNIEESICGFSRDELYEALKKENIISRKYFHPACNDFEPYKDKIIITNGYEVVVDKIKKQMLCMPFHSGVTDDDISVIREVVSKLTRS